MQSAQQIINSLKSYFVTHPVSRTFLFGSITNEKINDQSDIDIIVEFENPKSVGMKYVQMYLDLKKITRREIDLVTEDAISKYVIDKVQQQKMLIYERKAGRF